MDYSYEIDQIVAYWRPVLDLQNWDIRIIHSEVESLASCQAEPMYLSAVISFNDKRLNSEITNRIALEELVLHELVHIRLWMLANFIPCTTVPNILEYFEEEATTQVTGALLRVKYKNGSRETIL